MSTTDQHRSQDRGQGGIGSRDRAAADARTRAAKPSGETEPDRPAERPGPEPAVRPAAASRPATIAARTRAAAARPAARRPVGTAATPDHDRSTGQTGGQTDGASAKLDRRAGGADAGGFVGSQSDQSSDYLTRRRPDQDFAAEGQGALGQQCRSDIETGQSQTATLTSTADGRPLSRCERIKAPRSLGGAAFLFSGASLARKAVSRSIHGAKLGRARIGST